MTETRPKLETFVISREKNLKLRIWGFLTILSMILNSDFPSIAYKWGSHI
jgi:hypothetical protein